MGGQKKRTLVTSFLTTLSQPMDQRTNARIHSLAYRLTSYSSLHLADCDICFYPLWHWFLHIVAIRFYCYHNLPIMTSVFPFLILVLHILWHFYLFIVTIVYITDWHTGKQVIAPFISVIVMSLFSISDMGFYIL